MERSWQPEMVILYSCGASRRKSKKINHKRTTTSPARPYLGSGIDDLAFIIGEK